MVNYQHLNKGLHEASQLSSAPTVTHQHHNCRDDIIGKEKLIDDLTQIHVGWNLSKELRENLKNIPNLFINTTAATNTKNNNDNSNIDDTTTIESWTDSLKQSVLLQKILLRRMQNSNLYKNTSPLNYFSKSGIHNNNNNNNNMTGNSLPEKFSVKFRFRDFNESHISETEDQIATVHIFNRYLTKDELVEADQLHIDTDIYSSSDDVIDKFTAGQFIITPTSDEELGLDHNSRLHARHRIYEEYLKSLEKRYSIKLNESDVYSPSMNDDYHNDPIGYDLLPESLLMSTSTAAAAPDNIDYVDDGLYSTLTPGQTDQSMSVYQTKTRQSTTEEKITARKCEQERVQKKTFTNWLNTYLCNANPPLKVHDLFEDIKNGIMLIRILEVLSGQKLKAETRPQMHRIHCLSNIKTGLEFLHSKNVKLVNVNPTDIADGKPAIVLGLIWVIILYFQIEEQEELLLKILDLPAGSLKTRGSAKRALQAWVQEIFAGKYDVEIRDFGPSWRDGIAFNAMVHNIDSSLVEMDKVKTRTPKENLEHAFTIAEKHLGIPRLLDPEDVDVDRPDEKSIVTYVAQFFKAYPDAGRRRPDSPTKADVKVKIDSLMKFVRDSESKIRTARSGRSNLNDQYQIYDQLTSEKAEKEEIYESLKDQWYSGLLSHADTLVNPSEVEILEEAWNNLDDNINEWLWEMDSKVPGELGRISRWLCQAEKWFKQVGLKWYQKSSTTEAVGFCGTQKESWRPSSAEPTNSPPSSELLDKLQSEKIEIFGTNNHKLNSIRDDLPGTIANERSTGLPASLINQLGKRLSWITGYEPGSSAVLGAAKARRTFLDILYNINRTETSTGVRIRSRRRESATGFEHRYCNWLDLVDGNIQMETKEMVNGILTDYQLCLKTEHIPEKLDQCKCELGKHLGLLNKISQYDDKLLPKNALEVVQQWQDDCEAKWNVEKSNYLIQLGEKIKQRLTVWDKLDQYMRSIETSLSQLESSKVLLKENDRYNQRDEILRLLQEANEAADYLGESADHHRLKMFQKRIEQLDIEAVKRRQAENDRLEAERLAEKQRLEQKLTDILDKIESWVNAVIDLIECETPASSTSPSKSKKLQVRCTTNGLSIIVGQLQKLVDQQQQIIDYLHTALSTSHEPGIQPIHHEQSKRLHRLEDSTEKFISLLPLRLKDLIDMTDKMKEIEQNLSDASIQVKQLEKKQGRVLFDEDTNAWDGSQLSLDFNDCRGHLTFVNGQINDLDRALCLQANRGLTVLNRFSSEELQAEVKNLNERLTNAEKTIKREIAYKQSINEAFAKFKQQMNEIKEALKDLKSAISIGGVGASRKEELVGLLENVKTLQSKYSENMKVNEKQCENIINSAASHGDADSLINEMKNKISQMKSELNEQCLEINNELQGLNVQINKSIKEVHEAEDKVNKADKWLVNQERRITVLSVGPKALANDQVDSLPNRIKCYQQWVDECKNFMTSIKNQSQKHEIFSSRDEVDSVFLEKKTCTSTDLLESLSKRLERLEEDTQKLLNEAQKQMKTIGAFPVLIQSSRQWLHKAYNDYKEKLNNAAKMESSDHHLMNPEHLKNCLLVKLKCLTDFIALINNEGENRLAQCRNAVQQIADSTGRNDTTAVVMLARRELSAFHVELSNLQKVNEAELKKIQAKIDSHAKLVSSIETEENWLDDLEQQVTQNSSSPNGSQSIIQIISRIQADNTLYKQLLGSITSHGQQAYDRLQLEAQSLEDTVSIGRINTWQSRLQTLKHNLDEKTVNTNEQSKSLQEFKQGVDNFRLSLKNLERQRNTTLSTPTVSYVNMETDSQLLEDSYLTMRKQIEDLRVNSKTGLQTKYNNLKSQAKSLNFIPKDLHECQEQIDQFNKQLDQDYNEITCTLGEVNQLNKLVDSIKTVLKLNTDKILSITKKEPLGTSSLDVNELYTFYQSNFDEMKLISQNLGVELTRESPSNRNKSSKLSQLEEQIVQKIDSLILTRPKVSSFLSTMQSDLRSKINQTTSDAFERLSEASRFVTALHTVVICCKETQSSLDSIEKDYNSAYLKISTESGEYMIKQMNDLLGRINSEASVNQTTLIDSIQNVSSKYAYSSIDDILSTCLKHYTRRKEALTEKIKGTIEKCEQSFNLENNILENLRELDTEVNQLSDTIMNQMSDNISNAQKALDKDFEGRIDVASDKYVTLNSRYEKLRNNHKQANLNNDKINELIVSMSVKLENVDENLSSWKNSYKTQKENFISLQTKLSQCKDQLNKIRSEILRNLHKFNVKSTPYTSLKQSLEMIIDELTDYQSDFSNIHQIIINEKDVKSIEHFKINKCIDLHKLVIEIIQLKNGNTFTVLNPSVDWNDFVTELNYSVEWIQDILDEFRMILTDLNNLLTKMDNLKKLYEETKNIISEKCLPAEIDIACITVKSEKSSIKGKLIHDLETIKEYQLISIQNDFKAIKQKANRLLNKPQTGGQFKFIDDAQIFEYCESMEKSIDLLVNNLNDMIAKYKNLLENENQLFKLYTSVNEWIEGYENELSNLEDNIPTSNIQNVQSSPTHKHIEKHIQDANNLENKCKQGEKLLEMLINKLEQQKEQQKLTNTPEIKTLHERITGLSRSRLSNLKSALLNMKDSLDSLEVNGRNIDEELSKYESQLNRLKQTSTSLLTMMKMHNIDEIMKEEISTSNVEKWYALRNDLEGFKHCKLDPYEVMHNKISIKPSKDSLTGYINRYNKCLIATNERIGEIEENVMKLEKFKGSVREFNKYYDDANARFKQLMIHLKLDLPEDYSPSKLSEVCNLFIKNTQQTIANLNDFSSNCLDKLQATQTQISSQSAEGELKAAFESSSIFNQYTSFRCVLSDYIHDLSVANSELFTLHVDAVNYEKWFENLQHQFQETKGEALTEEMLYSSKSNIYHSNSSLSISQLDEESKISAYNLSQLNAHYQKALQRLRELQKSAANESLTSLAERFSTLIRQLVNTHSSLAKLTTERQLDGKTTNHRVDQICNTVKQTQQGVIQQINQDVNTIQAKLTYLTRLIQSNKDLDAWIKEFTELVHHLKEDSVNRKQFPLKDNSRTDEIQLKLDIGKTYTQPIHEWVEQLKQNEVNTSIQDLLTEQIHRSNQIFQYARKQIEGIKHEQNKQNELLKSFEAEFVTIENWFKKWKEAHASVKVKISNLLCDKNRLDEINKIDFEIDNIINSLNELKKELVTKNTQSLLLNSENNGNTTTNNNISNIEFNRSAQKMLLISEIDENQQSVEQNIVSLKRVKVKIRELSISLKKAKQWAGEVSEQMPRIRDGKSPIRISPYPLRRNETVKSGHWKTNYPTDSQYATSTFMPQSKQLHLKQSGEFRSATPPAFCSLIQQTRGKAEAVSSFIEDVTKSASLTAKDVNQLLDELEPDISELRMDSGVITTEIDTIQSQVEQIITSAIDYRQELEELIDQLSHLEDSLNNCKSWLSVSYTQIKKMSQQAISGITDLSAVNQSAGDQDQLLIDIFSPLDGLIQSYQVFQSELMSRKSELTQLNSLCEIIQKKTGDSSAKNSLNQLLVQIHSLIKSCEDVLSKLQLVFMENREFQVLCGNVKHFLDSLNSDLKGISKGDQISGLPEADLSTLTSMREKLRSSQPKLLELSDRADRICRASSTAALTMNQMFILHTGYFDAIDTANVSSPVPMVNFNQTSGIQHGFDNYNNTETVGSKARRQLNEFRKEFSEISQKITENQEKLSHLVNEQKNLTELYNDLRGWTEKAEKRLTVLQSGKLLHPTEGNEERFQAFSNLGSIKLSDNQWNVYVQQVKALHKELNEYTPKYEHFCDTLPNTSTFNGQTSKFNQLTERFAKLKEQVQQCAEWVNVIQQNLSVFRDSAQATERWMSSINFRLMSAGNNNITGNNNANLTGNLSIYQDASTQIDQLIREIDIEGKNLLENTHQSVHLLIHTISKDQMTKMNNRICDSVATCPYRQIPIDQGVIDNWKYLVNNSNSASGEQGLLERIALEVLERTKEIETSYVNIHTNAQSIKNRLDDRLNRFKSYIDALNSTATFILNDLQSWWRRLSLISQSSSAVAVTTAVSSSAAAVMGIPTVNQFLSASATTDVKGYTAYTNKNFINYQIDRLKQLATADKSPAKAVSLEDVGHQLAMTLAMQSQLITMKRELSALAYKCGMSSVEIDFISHESGRNTNENSNHQSNSTDQTLVKLLAKHVQNAIDLENKKLECHAEQLREMRTKWEHYVKERDVFSRWLSERQTACHHLLELRSRSTQPEDEERRALEDFLHSLQDREYQLTELLKMHQELIQRNPQITDSLLDRLNTEFKNLLNQTSSRIRHVEKEQSEKKVAEESHSSEYRGRIPILPEKAESLVQQSAKTLRHTQLLNELARSVRQLKHEVIDGEMDAQRSYSVGRHDEISNSSCAPVTSANQLSLKSSANTTLQQTISTESIRRNFPPSDYYPIIHLSKQSNSINNISSSSRISKARPQSSMDYTPVWCLDDTKQPGNRLVNQSKDATVSCYHTDGCQQYSASSLRKPSAYQIPWKEEISIENHNSNKTILSNF
uniref:Calponin-homology (CH) domain-containing protein n=1 Tax=Trichobilharzia regenti TaxID=157069 RepID=A0AA85JMI8_TRIRE|nr:unnamed protein product [Trichobilharzia regenti]